MTNRAKNQAARQPKTINGGGDEWYTPSRYLTLVLEVMGGIDCDPASSAIAQEDIQAGTFYTVQDDGLIHPWKGRVFLNPPYSRGKMAEFARKFLHEYKALNVTEGIVLTHANTDTGWFHDLAEECSGICFTRGRIRFDRIEDGQRVPGDSPTTGHCFFYFGPGVLRFKAVFSEIGLVAQEIDRCALF